ncbi:V-type ATP synthase subunit I [Candidatus Enterococcus ferrettii]|uniref:V/A-type H+/Na+-transporting ATPase subunit I n=1 Tax=Candidatus Enterococcus ferrettii TaxID=2815324 RepID=A0ABV0ETC5_9ENTE|nr:V-type ATP synthase subunit I [Enterococcus sp. 665A]MBO1341081.1 V-type ATP synthase subunit I [Enterococcus sp. 665A]
MAVSKMKKLTLIAEASRSDEILKAVQGFQEVEVRDVFQATENNQWVEAFFGDYQPESHQDKVQAINFRIEELANAIRFIDHHGSSKDKGFHLKRKILTLQQLEEKFDEAELDRELREIQTLEDRFNRNLEKIRELTDEESKLSRWQYLDVIPSDYKSSLTNVLLGAIDEVVWEDFKASLQQHETIYLEELYRGESEICFSLIFLNVDHSLINERIHSYGIVRYQYPYKELPKVRLQAISKELRNLYDDQKKMAKRIGQKRVNIEQLEWAEETLLARKNRLMVQDSYIQTHQLFVLQGWVSEDSSKNFQQFIAELVGQETIYLELEEPTIDEIATEIPIKLKNNKLVQPFEMLTEMYSLPAYHEVDPTPWFVPFYFVFFGMMVADAGYGALMLLVTTIVLKTKILPRGMTRFMQFFQILSIPTILWGLIYDSYFGFALPYKPILSTSDDVITILILSIVFGVIQIFVGLGLAAAENIKAKDYLSAVSDGFAWQGIFIGIIMAAGGQMLLGNQGLMTTGVVIAVLSALAIVFVPMMRSASKVKGLARGAYNLYGITGYIGDLVSYTRLMALGISGGSIAAAFNMLVGFMPPIARFSVGILLMLALHGLNIFLSLLSAYVHGARLQYVEFFGKFYQGGGRPFAPLKTEEKYVNIEQKEK